MPDLRLELVEDLSPAESAGFLRLVRRRFRVRYPDGSQSPPFVYDEVDRSALDAVVIAAYYVEAGERFVYLRSAFRPPVVCRDRTRSPVPELDPAGSIWELPAGLVEQSEQSRSGLARAAARELHEELGFELDASELEELGPSTFPAPGVIAERHFFFACRVRPGARAEPPNDGSVLEHGGAVVALPLPAALEMCRGGRIVDAKTELGLRRLAERTA